jgi:putative ABC transport system permease protein
VASGAIDAGMTRGTLALALFLGPLRQSKGRAALALAAIALGVALGYAVQLVNQSAIAEFAQAVQTLSGTADIEIRGRDSTKRSIRASPAGPRSPSRVR